MMVSQQQPSSVDLQGVPLHAVTYAQCIEHILHSLESGRGGWVVTHNLDHLRRLRLDGEFRDLCLDADLRVADGMPVVWACRLQGTPVPERVAGSTLVSLLSEAAAKKGRSIFLLGGARGSAAAAARRLVETYASLEIAGIHYPSFGFERDPRQMSQLRDELVSANPDIVFVALGSPKQEQLIKILRDDLPQTWFLGVGISFSFLSGDVRRAPRWMQNVGLEWVHRLSQEPGRLSKRYLQQGIPYAARLLTSAALRRGQLRKDSPIKNETNDPAFEPREQQRDVEDDRELVKGRS